MHCTKAGTIALGISGMRLTSVCVRETNQTYLDGGDGGENEGGVGVAERVQQAEGDLVHVVVAHLRLSVINHPHVVHQTVQHRGTTALHAREQRQDAALGEGGEPEALAGVALAIPVQEELEELDEDRTALEEAAVHHGVHVLEQRAGARRGAVLVLCDRVLAAQRGLVKLLLKPREEQRPDGVAILLG